MNLYRITYGTPDSETETTNITERSETAARKAFKASCKAFCSIIPDIIGIELIREDVGATKQQERDTLAAIMQMVEELGPNSYLATAFAGCFEDAEENIENDFAFSMKERYESSKKDADYFHEAANTFSNDLDKARDEIAAIKAELARRYGWPLKIHARGYDAYLVGAQPLLEGGPAPIYRFPGGDSLVDECEMLPAEEASDE